MCFKMYVFICLWAVLVPHNSGFIVYFFFFLTYAGDSNPALDLSVWRVHVLSGTPASFHSPKTCMRLG